jgi:chromosome segregation ATPase
MLQFMEKLMALSVEPGDQDSVAKSLVALKSELAEEKATWEKAWVEVETLAEAIEDLKKTTSRFAAQVPTLEEKVKHLDNKVIDSLTEPYTKELSLEWTTKANEDYKSQNSRLTKKLETKHSLLISPRCCLWIYY